MVSITIYGLLHNPTLEALLAWPKEIISMEKQLQASLAQMLGWRDRESTEIIVYFIPTISSANRPREITVFVNNLPRIYGKNQDVSGLIKDVMRSMEKQSEETRRENPYGILILPEQTITVVVR